MAFRGRGRGRGRGGFGYGGGRYAKQEEYKLFPEIEELPAVNFDEKEKEFGALVKWSADLQKFWKLSPYYYEGMGEEAERNGGKIGKPPLSDFIKMTDDYVPAELGAKNVKRCNKKVRWNPQSDLQRLDFFEKLDLRTQVQDGDEKEKKEDEEDDEDINVEEEDEDSDDDYVKNLEFDDDEDDFNMADDGDDEGFY